MEFYWSRTGLGYSYFFQGMDAEEKLAEQFSYDNLETHLNICWRDLTNLSRGMTI